MLVVVRAALALLGRCLRRARDGLGLARGVWLRLGLGVGLGRLRLWLSGRLLGRGCLGFACGLCLGCLRLLLCLWRLRSLSPLLGLRRLLGRGCLGCSGGLVGRRRGGGDLARLHLVSDLAQRRGQPAQQGVERPHETAHGRCDDAHELPVEDVARGQARECADLLDVERTPVHDAALEGQKLGRASVVGDRLGGRGRVAAHEGQRGGADQQLLQRLGARRVCSAFGQGVLDDLEGRVGVAQAAPQLGDLGHRDAPVVDREDRL